MFKSLSVHLQAIGLLCLLTMSGWIWHQANQIDDLTAENKHHVEMLVQQQTVNLQLQAQLEEEQQAVISQQELANTLRTQMESKREQVKTILVKGKL